MGIFSGFIYFEWKNGNKKVVAIIEKIKNSIFLRILFYVVGIGLTQFVIWVIVPFQQGEIWSNLSQALYNSLNRYFFIFIQSWFLDWSLPLCICSNVWMQKWSNQIYFRSLFLLTFSKGFFLHLFDPFYCYYGWNIFFQNGPLLADYRLIVSHCHWYILLCDFSSRPFITRIVTNFRTVKDFP